MSNTITVKNFATNLDRLRVPLSSFEREKRKGNIPYYGAAKIIDYVDGFTHTGLSVLIAEDGSVETKDGYPVVQLADGQYWVNNHTHVLKGKDDIDTIYLYYALQTVKVAPFVTGAVQKKISQQALNSMEIPYFEDQNFRKIIVNILSKFDEKIQLNTQINQTLEQIAQAIFKSWFVDFDPVRAKAAALESGKTEVEAELAAMQAISGKTAEELAQMPSESYAELAEIAKAFPSEFGEDGVPMGWEVKTLSDLGQIVCGKTPSKSNKDFYGDDIPFIKIPDMHNQLFITKTTDNLSFTGANSQPKKYIPARSICVSCIATVGLVSMTSKPSHTNQQINSIIPNDESFSEFLYLSLKQPSMTKYLKDLASGGSATLNLNTSTFSKIDLITPSKTILDIFHKKISDIFDRVLSNSVENEKLAGIRDLLLPRLLNGEI